MGTAVGQLDQSRRRVSRYIISNTTNPFTVVMPLGTRHCNRQGHLELSYPADTVGEPDVNNVSLCAAVMRLTPQARHIRLQRSR